MPHSTSDVDLKIAEQAAEWLIELDQADPPTLARFASWLKASPRHVEEFLLVSAVWAEFDDFDPDRQFAIRRMLESAASNVQPLTAATPPSHVGTARKTSRRPWFAAAVVVFAAVIAALWITLVVQPGTYDTALGEQRSFKLEDGSIVHLNTRSRVEVRFSHDARTVRLLEGEAMFAVERDPARPFRVMSGDAVIQVVGTQFNVYRRAEGTTVSVVEGVVQVSPVGSGAARSDASPVNAPSPENTMTQGTLFHKSRAYKTPARLAAGEQAQVSAAGEIVTQAVPDIAGVVAWRERRLVFRGDSLDVVAREFNRYNRLQIRIDGDEVRTKRLTAVFDADDPDSLVQFLKGDIQLEVQTSDQEVVIRAVQ